jgi:hypothetical protein
MNTHVLLGTSTLLPLCGIAFFGILFPIIHSILKQNKLFQGWSATVVAVCVTCLCLIGMYQTFFPDEMNEGPTEGIDQPGIRPLLVPYTALGVAILLMLLLMWLGRILCRSKVKKLSANTIITKSQYLGKQKEDKPISVKQPTNHTWKNEQIIHPGDSHQIQTWRNSDPIRYIKPDIKQRKLKQARNIDR